MDPSVSGAGPGTASSAPEASRRSDTGVVTRATIVNAGDGRGVPATHVRLLDFDGPLGLLLALIEARQLDILSVPLGELAEAYLDALAGLDADRIGSVSGFVAVAGQLILIKSRALLPRRLDPTAIPLDDSPDPEAELRARLILYRAYRDAGSRLLADARLRGGLFRREPSTAQASGRAGAVTAPPPRLDPAILGRRLDQLLRVLPPPAPPPEAMARTITIGQRAAIIRAALRRADRVVLQELLRGVGDRVVIAVTFLAMLELMKRREIVVEQAEPWGPIVARVATASERAAAGLVSVSIDDPFDEQLESFG